MSVVSYYPCSPMAALHSSVGCTISYLTNPLWMSSNIIVNNSNEHPVQWLKKPINPSDPDPFICGEMKGRRGAFSCPWDKSIMPWGPRIHACLIFLPHLLLFLPWPSDASHRLQPTLQHPSSPTLWLPASGFHFLSSGFLPGCFSLSGALRLMNSFG